MWICFYLGWVSTDYFLDIEIGLFDCFSVSWSLHLDMKMFCPNNVVVFSYVLTFAKETIQSVSLFYEKKSPRWEKLSNNERFIVVSSFLFQPFRGHFYRYEVIEAE